MSTDISSGTWRTGGPQDDGTIRVFGSARMKVAGMLLWGLRHELQSGEEFFEMLRRSAPILTLSGKHRSDCVAAFLDGSAIVLLDLGEHICAVDFISELSLREYDTWFDMEDVGDHALRPRGLGMLLAPIIDSQVWLPEFTERVQQLMKGDSPSEMH